MSPLSPTIGMRVEVKKLFFDRPAVTRLIDRKTQRILARQGGYVRTVARNSMKRRRGSSPAGSPPNVHEGGLKRGTFFALEPRRRVVVIGPVAFRNSSAPAALEHGGFSRGRGRKKQYIRARPFMRPALHNPGTRQALRRIIREEGRR